MQLVAHFAHWLLVENADPGKTFTAGKKSEIKNSYISKWWDQLVVKSIPLIQTTGMSPSAVVQTTSSQISSLPHHHRWVSSRRKSQQLPVYLVYWTLFIFTGWCQQEPSAALVWLPHGPDVSDRHRRWLWHAHVLHELNSHGNWSCQGRRRLGLLQVRSHQVDRGGYASTYCWWT